MNHLLLKLLQETLSDYPYIIYLDSSVRFLKTINVSHTWNQIQANGGILQMARTGYKLFVTTHPTLYKYFGSNIDKLKKTGMSLFSTHISKVRKNVYLYVSAFL